MSPLQYTSLMTEDEAVVLFNVARYDRVRLSDGPPHYFHLYWSAATVIVPNVPRPRYACDNYDIRVDIMHDTATVIYAIDDRRRIGC